MHIHLLCIGRLKASPLRQVFDEYKKRLTWPFTLHELETKSGLKGSALKEKEAELLLAALPSGSICIALDERGQNITSPQFSQMIQKYQNQGIKSISLIIGGADGLDASIRARANLTISFGALTWPHMMVRAMVMEQLYRAQQILANHPYHRE